MSKVLFNLIYYKSCFAKGEEHLIHVTTETPIFSNCFPRRIFKQFYATHMLSGSNQTLEKNKNKTK